MQNACVRSGYNFAEDNGTMLLGSTLHGTHVSGALTKLNVYYLLLRSIGHPFLFHARRTEQSTISSFRLFSAILEQTSDDYEPLDCYCIVLAQALLEHRLTTWWVWPALREGAMVRAELRL
eukprot:1257168-Pleurochrysis_carterae.AAC.4